MAMKTVLAAVAAGLIGAGASTGLIVSGVIPVGTTINQTARVAPATEAPDNENDTLALKREIETLRAEQGKLRSEIKREQPAAVDPRVTELEAEVAALKRARTLPVEAPKEGPAVETGQFDTAVRDVITRVEEERVEQRRLERQADRIKNLEAAKQRLTDSVPRTIQHLSARLNIPETSVNDVSNVLVLHAQTRAEIRSERQGQQIDRVEIDQAGYEQKLKDLDQATMTSLGTHISAETAQSALNLVNRTQRGIDGRDTATPGTREGFGRDRQNRRTRGGNDNNN
jgi:hypothetical protein